MIYSLLVYSSGLRKIIVFISEYESICALNPAKSYLILNDRVQLFSYLTQKYNFIYYIILVVLIFFV